jgi:hypothetical protein
MIAGCSVAASGVRACWYASLRLLRQSGRYDDSDDEAEGQSQQNLAETSSHPIYTGEASPVEDRLPETNGENSAAISSSDSDEDSNQDEDEDDQ